MQKTYIQRDIYIKEYRHKEIYIYRKKNTEETYIQKGHIYRGTFI